VKDFIRVLKYLKREIKSVILSFLFAIAVALLFTGSIGIMLPLMEVVMSDNPHQDIHVSVIQRRFGMTITPTGENQLVISAIASHSIAAQGGIIAGDILTNIRFIDDEIKVPKAALLRFIAFDTSMNDLSKVLFETTNQTGGLKSYRLSETHNNWRDNLKVSLNKKVNNLIAWGTSFLPEGEDFVTRVLTSMVGFMLSMTLLRCILRAMQEYIVKRIGFRIVARIRNETFKTAIALPVIYFTDKGSTDIISRFVQDVNKISRAINAVLGKTVREPLKMGMTLFAAFAINAKVTAIIIIVFPLVGFTIYHLGRKLKTLSRKILEERSRLLGRLQESLQGIREVKAYHREAFEYDAFSAVNKKLLRRQYKRARLNAAAGPILEVFGTLAASIGMYVGVKLLTTPNPEITPAEFITISALLITAGLSGQKLGNVITRVQVANAAAGRVFELMDQTSVEQDTDNGIDIPPMTQSIELKDISFSYPNTDAPAISNINLSIVHGQSIAVVGPNGCGKSTLLGLLSRFYTPQHGTISFDGIDITTGTFTSVRNQISIVSQQTVLFNNSILNNIKYGRLDATRDEVISAAKQANAHDFIEQKDEGYNTIISEQGTNLSGGQRQRLSIARAILRDAPILIFDEATSQIDVDSADKIQEAISKMSKGRTCFIIAHHLKSIVHCDKIVVMNEGRIVDIGTHDILIEKCALYQKLYKLN